MKPEQMNQNPKKKNVQIMNKNDSSKPSPYTSQKMSLSLQHSNEFSLRTLNPTQMKDLNEMLE